MMPWSVSTHWNTRNNCVHSQMYGNRRNGSKQTPNPYNYFRLFSFKEVPIPIFAFLPGEEPCDQIFP